MLQIVNPTFEETRDLKHLRMNIRFYDGKSSNTSISLNDKKTGYMIFHKSFDKYEDDAIKIVKEFIDNFNKEKEGLQFDETKKMYFDLTNHNW